jgi:phage N-6-adenine-methyltransferase
MRRQESYTFAIPEWETPAWLFGALDAEFHFTVDVAAQSWNAKCAQYFTPDDDAIEQPWTGVCWLNPPYGSGLDDWLAKAWAAAQCGATVVALVPARTDARWFHDYGLLADELRFIRGRLKFSAAGRAPFASIVLVFRPERAGVFPRIAVIDPSQTPSAHAGGVMEPTR